jgi:hypothetical protein
MKETLVEAVGFRVALPNLQILVLSQFQLEFLRRGCANERVTVNAKPTIQLLDILPCPNFEATSN